MARVFYIKLFITTFLLSSCATVSDWTDNIVSSNDTEIVESDEQLLSDELGDDPSLAEILADSDENFYEPEPLEEIQSVDETNLEIADEKLPSAAPVEYDSEILSYDDNQEFTEEPIESTENTFDSAKSPQIDFERPIINLNDKIQYRVATISFSSGSSQVSISGRKKIKKIAKIAKERDAKIKIIGHASERTRDMPISEHKIVNFIISDKRANSVAEIFIKNHKFPSNKLITQGVSDSKPLFKEIMPAGTKANQRTEIFLIY
mgnify:CR=1 FL=1